MVSGSFFLDGRRFFSYNITIERMILMSVNHFVICAQCGKKFDANKGAAFDPQAQRYICRQCVSRAKAELRQQNTGMRQSTGAMIAKIVFGLLFVMAGFSSPEGGWSVGYFLTALVIGGGLIAWGVLPWLKAKKSPPHSCDADTPGQLRVCPHCGGTGTSEICEYCGMRIPE